MRTEQIKINTGSVRIPVTLVYDDDRIFVKFGFNRALIIEIKNMEGARWHGFEKPNPRKIWSIANSPRNHFQLSYLQGHNPYAYYDTKIIEQTYDRPLMAHQKMFADFMLAKRRVLLAGEMGVGKTLSVIEVMERSGSMDWWYIAPKSALKAVHLEFKKWNMAWRPRTLTYEGMTKEVKNWEPGRKAPFGVVFDESARLKNPTSQRSQAAMHLANAIRTDHENGYIILMSGAPAPKSPLDWWHQCEVVCPGFLKEGNIAKFKKRLAIVVQKESVAGGMYPSIVSWLDDSKKCSECGEYLESVNHSMAALGDEEYHEFKPSKNEVAYLFERMQGLVQVTFKKDCLDLPDKIYRTIELEPSQKIINLAQGIVSRARNTITAITQLRTLSDGFMYKKEDAGEETCPVCGGIEDNRPIINDQKYCDRCSNSGMITKIIRKTYQVETPKEAAVIDLLDEHIEVGRIVFYAGFTGSIERLVDICQKCDWQTIRADGYGWKTSFDGDPLEEFQQGSKIPRIAFVGQPGAAGTGLTLTASPTICYYSNDFDADHRIQSEDRCHRIGMDANRGCTIIDLIHLPTDLLVIDNLQKKRALQSLTLGEIKESLQ